MRGQALSPLFIMVDKALIEHIEQFLAPEFKGTDLFLVDVKGGNSGKIEVFIDRKDQNITIDKCAEISRLLEEKLEENNLVGEKYVLEVSSPGMSNPFKVMEQYEKSIGKHISVLTIDNLRLKGILKSVDTLGIELEEHKKVKKQKQPKILMHALAFDQIREVKKQIKFK